MHAGACLPGYARILSCTLRSVIINYLKSPRCLGIIFKKEAGLSHKAGNKILYTAASIAKSVAKFGGRYAREI